MCALLIMLMLVCQCDKIYSHTYYLQKLTLFKQRRFLGVGFAEVKILRVEIANLSL